MHVAGSIVSFLLAGLFAWEAQAFSGEKLSCAQALSDEAGMPEQIKDDPMTRHGVYNAISSGSSFILPWTVSKSNLDRVIVTYVYYGQALFECDIPLPDVNQQRDFALVLGEFMTPISYNVQTVEIASRVRGKIQKRLDFITGSPRMQIGTPTTVNCRAESADTNKYLDQYIMAVVKEAQGACLNKSNILSNKVCWDSKNPYLSKAQVACAGVTPQLDRVFKNLFLQASARTGQ